MNNEVKQRLYIAAGAITIHYSTCESLAAEIVNRISESTKGHDILVHSQNADQRIIKFRAAYPDNDFQIYMSDLDACRTVRNLILHTHWMLFDNLQGYATDKASKKLVPVKADIETAEIVANNLKDINEGLAGMYMKLCGSS